MGNALRGIFAQYKSYVSYEALLNGVLGGEKLCLIAL